MRVINKAWGTTQLLLNCNNTETCLIRVEAGKQCSVHCHHHKYNRFFVISGELVITIFDKNQQSIKDIVLRENCSYDVIPGVWHQFTAKGYTVAMECYWVELEPWDIERK